MLVREGGWLLVWGTPLRNAMAGVTY